MRLSLSIILFVSLLGSCIGNRAVTTSEPLSIDSIEYARGFTIARHDGFTEVNVRDPWDSTRILQRYLLVDRSLNELPANMGNGTVVKVPLDKLVVYSSVHASIIELLRAEEHVVGLCEVKYIDSKVLKRRLNEGIIADIGESTAPNIEKIIDIGTEAIVSSPFKDAGYGPAEKLGVPIIEGADYMENHPLGRVEWIKFFGLLVGAEDVADSIYKSTCVEYNKLKVLTSNITHRPTLLAERKYGGQWFVPGGESYNAVMYADAGADYIFDDELSEGTVPLAFESVLDRGIHADIWLMKYYNEKDMSYRDLAEEFEPYTNFDAYKSRKIYGCNSHKVMYYEDAPMHPHLILKDYIHIFHPDLLPDYEPKYYFPLAE